MDYVMKMLDLHDQPTLTMRAIYPVEKLPEFFGIAYNGVMTYLQELGEAQPVCHLGFTTTLI